MPFKLYTIPPNYCTRSTLLNLLAGFQGLSRYSYCSPCQGRSASRGFEVAGAILGTHQPQLQAAGLLE